jgi:hypothetical protein
VPAITRPALPSLKHCSSLSDHPFAKTAPADAFAKDRLDEICELRHQLLLEKAKNMELQQQIEEMTQCLADYGFKWAGADAGERRARSGHFLSQN